MDNLGEVPAAIEVRSLSKSFKQHGHDLRVVSELSLKVPKGIVFGLLGPNGAGKTTTIRMLCGVLEPTSGSGRVAGVDLKQRDLLKQRIGYATQSGNLYFDLTTEENLRFKAMLYLPASQVRRAVEDVMARLGLTPYRKRLAGKLSGGWRQRLMIGTAIIHNPSVIFLDEPTAAVDPVGRRELWDTIYDLTADGTTVFVSTHYMEEAERCHRIAMLARGRLLIEGEPAEIRTQTPGHFYHFLPQSLIEGLHRARALPEAQGAWISGNTVRLMTKAPLPEDFLEGAAERLVAVPPTLEDAFVTLMPEEGVTDGR